MSDNEDHIEYESESYFIDTICEVIYDRYIIIKYVSYGTFSRVWLGYDPIEDKCMILKLQHPEYLEDAKEEYEMIRKIDTTKCPRLSHVYDGFEILKYNERSFAFIMEILGQSLYDYIDKNDRLEFSDSIRIFKEILSALDYVHNKGFIHTDIKSENILFEEKSESIKNFLNFFNSLEPQKKFQDIISKNLPEDYNSRTTEARRKLRKRAKSKSVLLLAEVLKEELQEYIYNNLSDSDSDTEDYYDSDSDSDSDTGLELETDSDPETESKPKQESRAQKQETVLTQRPKLSSVKLSDFGGCVDKDYNYTNIQTRSFRALEVILGEDVTEKIDIWSMGPLLFEMVTGEEMFDLEEFSGENRECDRKHLSEIVKYLGKIPEEISLECENTYKLFTKNNKIKDYPKIKRVSLKDRLPSNFTEKQKDIIQTIVSECCVYNPNKRKNAKELLEFVNSLDIN